MSDVAGQTIETASTDAASSVVPGTALEELNSAARPPTLIVPPPR